MDRAIASGAIGREFESLRAHQISMTYARPALSCVRKVCNCWRSLQSSSATSDDQERFVRPRDAVIHGIHHLIDGIWNFFDVIFKSGIRSRVSQLLLYVLERALAFSYCECCEGPAKDLEI